MLKVAIIIPAYHEELAIAGVLQNLHATNPLWIPIVIDDGSKDRTAEVARATGIGEVVSLPCNLGIGGAVQTGFKLAMRRGFDIAIQFDGDGQHDAAEIPRLLQPIEEQTADVVIGSRFVHAAQKGFRSTPMRRLGIKIFEWVNTLIIRQRISDNTSGFRAYNRKALALLADEYPVDYPEPEAIILLGKAGLRICEIPVLMHERQGGESSISGFKSAHYMVKVLLSIFLQALRPLPRRR